MRAELVEDEAVPVTAIIKVKDRPGALWNVLQAIGVSFKCLHSIFLIAPQSLPIIFIIKVSDSYPEKFIIDGIYNGSLSAMIVLKYIPSLVLTIYYQLICTMCSYYVVSKRETLVSIISESVIRMHWVNFKFGNCECLHSVIVYEIILVGFKFEISGKIINSPN